MSYYALQGAGLHAALHQGQDSMCQCCTPCPMSLWPPPGSAQYGAWQGNGQLTWVGRVARALEDCLQAHEVLLSLTARLPEVLPAPDLRELHEDDLDEEQGVGVQPVSAAYRPILKNHLLSCLLRDTQQYAQPRGHSIDGLFRHCQITKMPLVAGVPFAQADAGEAERILSGQLAACGGAHFWTPAGGMTPLLNQTTSDGSWGMTPAAARISGAMHPAAPNMAHLCSSCPCLASAQIAPVMLVLGRRFADTPDNTSQLATERHLVNTRRVQNRPG